MVAKCGYSTCFVVIIIMSRIIIIIYKNENPMVCLLALWVYKRFFPKDQQLYFV